MGKWEATVDLSFWWQINSLFYFSFACPAERCTALDTIQRSAMDLQGHALERGDPTAADRLSVLGSSIVKETLDHPATVLGLCAMDLDLSTKKHGEGSMYASAVQCGHARHQCRNAAPQHNCVMHKGKSAAAAGQQGANTAAN